MRRTTMSVLVLLVVLALPAVAAGSTQTFTTGQSPINGTPNMGWWSPTLSNSDGNPTYSTGWFQEGVNFTDHKLRSFFTFKLDGLCGSPQGAMLELTRQHDADKGLVTLGLFDVSTSAAALAAKGNNPDAGIFADLGSGATYGGLTVDTNTGAPTDVLSMPLNATALGAIQAATGQYFSIGAALTDPADGFAGPTPTIALFEAGAGGVQRLVVTCTDAAPTNTAPPAVSGSAAVGATLTCDPGQWTSVPVSFATAWLRDGTPIPGATGATYVVTSADAGTTVTCRVVASSNGGDSPPATAPGVKVPVPAAPPPAPAPAPPAAQPAAAPQPVAISSIATLPSPKACVSRRRFPIRLRGVRASRIVRAQIRLDGRQVRNVTGKALGLPIDLRGLPKGRFTVEIVTTDSTGRRVVGRRTYRTCAPRKG